MSSKAEPYVLLENHWGIYQPMLFCNFFADALREQGLGYEADVINRSAAGDADDNAWAWTRILENFKPEEGYHLAYMPDDQALFAVPDGYEWEE